MNSNNHLQLIGSGLLGAALTYMYFKHKSNNTTKSSTKRKKKRRIAILGGAFNPITDAHLQMAAEVIHSCAADEVWFVPCGPRIGKKSLKTSVLHRYFMCQLAVTARFSSNFPVKVVAEELLLDKAYYTYWLLLALDKKYGKDCTMCFVVGSDLLSGIPTWGGPKEWYLEREFVVFPREKFNIPQEWIARQNVVVLGPVDDILSNDTGLILTNGNENRKTPPQQTLMESNLSSTEVRRRLDATRGTLRDVLGHPTFKAEGLVPSSVLRYIQKYELLMKKKEHRFGSITSTDERKKKKR